MYSLELSVVVHDCNPSTEEAELGEFHVQAQPGPYLKNMGMGVGIPD